MTLDYIWTVIQRFNERYIFRNSNFMKPFVLDLSGKKLCQISNTVDDKDIAGILFCDFKESDSSIARGPASFFKNNKNELITDNKIPVLNFTWWYGINEGKLFIDKLENIDDDLLIMPVRNLKRIVQKPFDKILIKRNIVFLTNGEVNVQLPYEQLNNNIGKCILISPDGHSLFIYGVKENSINELEIIKNFLNEHPAYPVMVDNGRYLFYFVGENITKDDFVCGGLHKIDELYIIGFCKDTK